jgi:hypothetical protein
MSWVAHIFERREDDWDKVLDLIVMAGAFDPRQTNRPRVAKRAYIREVRGILPIANFSRTIYEGLMRTIYI